MTVLLENMAANSRFPRLSIAKIQGEMGNAIPETTKNPKSFDKELNYSEFDRLVKNTGT